MGCDETLDLLGYEMRVLHKLAIDKKDRVLEGQDWKDAVNLYWEYQHEFGLVVNEKYGS